MRNTDLITFVCYTSSVNDGKVSLHSSIRKEMFMCMPAYDNFYGTSNEECKM